jgi:hypothetical protein
MQANFCYAIFLFLWFAQTRGIDFFTCDLKQQVRKTKLLKIDNTFRRFVELHAMTNNLLFRVFSLIQIND